MIPIIFPRGATNFVPGYLGAVVNGLGRIPECTQCKITEDVTGIYECEFTVPTNAEHYADIVERNIILCKVPGDRKAQAFDIYARDESIEGLTTFYAHHISYRLSNIVVKPVSYYSNTSLLTIVGHLNSAAAKYNTSPFTLVQDAPLNTRGGGLVVSVPSSMRQVLGDGEGCLHANYSIDYEYDNFNIIVHASRGSDTGVTIYYGKNLTAFDRNIDWSETFNACLPYAVNSVTGEVAVPSDDIPDISGIVYMDGVTSDTAIVMPVDVTENAENIEDWPPSGFELMDLGRAWLTANSANVPRDNIDISFEQLWQTTEYADIATLEQVRLFDRVTVVYGPARLKLEGVTVVKTEYDVLNERYSAMELGTIQQNYGDTVRGIAEKAISDTVPAGMDMASIQIPYNLRNQGGTVVWDTLNAKLKRGIICAPD